jgi:hypothetical protein
MLSLGWGGVRIYHIKFSLNLRGNIAYNRHYLTVICDVDNETNTYVLLVKVLFSCTNVRSY